MADDHVLERRPATLLRQSIDVLVVALGGMLVTLLVAGLFQSAENDRFNQAFSRDAGALANSVDRQVAVKLRDLDALKTFFVEAQTLSPSMFERITAPFLDNALALGWVMPVDATYRSRLETELSLAYGRPVSILDPVLDASVEPADPRTLYFPLVFIASNVMPNPPIGMDMMIEPRRQRTLQRAIENRQLAATEPLQLVTGGTGGTWGLSLLLPVFNAQGLDPDSGYGVTGLLLSAFDFEGLLGLPDMARQSELAIRLIHTASDGSSLVVVDSGVPDLEAPADALSQTVQIADQTYRLELRPGLDYASGRHRAVWMPVLMAGTIITLLLSAYLLGIKVQRGRTQQLVERRTRELRATERRLRQLAVTDELTGLFNRRHLEEMIERELGRLQRYAEPASIIMFDLDHFKEINDSLGHEAGDRVLRQVARLLEARIRQTDTGGRWGGEEFMILCPGARDDQAAELAEQIRGFLASLHMEGVPKITASFGVTAIQASDSSEELLRRVDALLYDAKRAGRNRVVAG